MSSERLIGSFAGKMPGPLVVSIGGMHGNEPAGVGAIQSVLQLLKAASAIPFYGKLAGFRGNVRALANGSRFLKQDMNRLWKPELIHQLSKSGNGALEAEDAELAELVECIEAVIREKSWTQIFLLDLHTTSAEGDIFSVVSNRPENVGLGLNLHAPVVKGLLYRLEGTILHYFDQRKEIISTSFEAGQHQDPLSETRATGALINCLKSAGCVRDYRFGLEYDALLRAHCKNLPALVQVTGYHKVREGDEFRMVPGYKNFQQVKQGEVLAYDRSGPITAPENCRILMPRYQPLGEDGFFLVRETSGF